MMMMKMCLEERGLKFNFERNQFIIFVKRRIAFFFLLIAIYMVLNVKGLAAEWI